MSAPATAEVLSVSPAATSRRRARDLWRGVARVGESTPATVGVLIILFWLAVAVLAPLLAPYPPNASDLAALAHPTPSRAHWLGTDHLGRDLLSRLAWGARPVLVIAPLAVLGATALGCLLGLAAGYHRPWSCASASTWRQPRCGASRRSTSCWSRSCRMPAARCSSTCVCAPATTSSSSASSASSASGCRPPIPTGAAWSRIPTG